MPELPIEQVEKLTIEILRKHRNDPVLFVKEALGGTPTPQQVMLLRAAAEPGARVAVRSGHGVGKSTTLAWIIIWFLCTHDDARVPATAPTGHQLSDILWNELRKWIDKLHPWYKQFLRVTDDKVTVEGGTSFAVARTSRKETPEALQGFHGRNMLFVIDEASGVPEQVFEVAQGALSTKGARTVMAANPTQLSGFFHDAFYRDRERWTRLVFSSEDSPLVSKEYVDYMAQTYGRDSDIFKVRVLGEFPSTSISQLISPELVEAAMKKSYRIEQYQHMPKCLAADVSYFGDDACALYLRQGLVAQEIWRGYNINTYDYATLIARFWREMHADACFIDITGWGAGVYDTLQAMNFKPMPVVFGGRADNPERFMNKRIEIWWRMKEWLESGGQLPDMRDLSDDLCVPEYYYTPSGKMALERKEDIKKRGFPSPDRADALAMTFAYAVQSKAMSGSRGQPAKVKTKYDIFNRKKRRN